MGKQDLESLINFSTHVGNLKRKKRKGWVVWHDIDNSESTSSHIFRTALLAWVLGEEEKDLNTTKLIKMALGHDLCEVFAEDETPYAVLLPEDKDPEKMKEILKKHPRVQSSLEDRKKQKEKKFNNELEGLEKLISDLPQDLKKEIKNLWLDYEKKLSKEGRFAKQIDKLENLLQGLEYWKEQGQIQKDLWIMDAKERIENENLQMFLDELDNEFSDKEAENKKYRAFVKFFINCGKLKRKKRRGWTVLHDLKNSETTADHVFRATILSWLLGKEEKTLDLEEMIKMTLVHDLCEVFAKDEIPYEGLVDENSSKEEKRKIRKKRSRTQYTKEERKKRLEEKSRKEKEALDKLLKDLPKDFSTKAKHLWQNYENKRTKEARFVKQIDRLESLMQALEYWKEQGQIERDLWLSASSEWATNKNIIEAIDVLRKKYN